jgi:putative MATE family efflux protein
VTAQVKPPSLTQGSLTRRLAELAGPFLLANLLHLAVLAADRIWIGRVGTSALAGLGLAHVAIMICFTLLLGPAIGTLAGVAQHIGSGNRDKAEKVLGQGILISIILGLAFGLSALIAPQLVLSFMGEQANVSTATEAYLRVSLFALCFQAPLLVLTFAIQGAGDAKAALVIQAIAPMVNGVLDPILIFGLDWGMVGAAWASVFGYGCALVIGLAMVTGDGLRIRLIRPIFRFDRRVSSQVIRVGVPGTIEQIVRTSALFLLVRILAQFGQVILSAYTVTIMITLVFVRLGVALGQATATLVGQNVSAGKLTRAWKTAWISVSLYGCFMVFSMGLLWYFSVDLIGIFDAQPDVVAEGGHLLKIMACSFPGIAVALILSKAFAGASKTKPPMIAAALAHLVFQIPLAWYWSKLHGPQGAYWAMTIAFYVHAALNAYLFWYYFAPSRTSSKSVIPGDVDS